MKKAELSGAYISFSVDYNAIALSNYVDIHKYLMKKNKIK